MVCTWSAVAELGDSNNSSVPEITLITRCQKILITHVASHDLPCSVLDANLTACALEVVMQIICCDAFILPSSQ